MKTSMIVLFGLMTLTLARLDINSAACTVFTSKFGAANSANGTGATQLAFTGNVGFINSTANVQVTLQYSDNTYYNNATYYGLVQEDGHTADETCLDLKLYKYDSASYTNEAQVTDLTIQHTSNFQKKWRYYYFVINGSDLATRLVQTTNSNQYVYNGYYAIKYYAAGTTQLQYTFYFSFSVTVDRTTGAGVDTVFHPLSYTESLACSSSTSCSVSTSTTISWCSDFTCSTKITAPSLYLNDQFVLMQTIATSGLTGYYLANATIYYIGNGLNKQATIQEADYSHAGYAIYLLNAEIAWSSVTIQVQAYLSTTASRLLEERILDDTQSDSTQLDPVTGKTDEITCIKYSTDSDTCATCEEQCSAQGYADSSCTACSSAAQLAFAIMFIFMIMF